MEYKLVIVAFAHGEGNNAVILEVENGAQVQFFVVALLEFGYVR